MGQGKDIDGIRFGNSSFTHNTFQVKPDLVIALGEGRMVEDFYVKRGTYLIQYKKGSDAMEVIQKVESPAELNNKIDWFDIEGCKKV